MSRFSVLAILIMFLTLAGDTHGQSSQQDYIDELSELVKKEAGKALEVLDSLEAIDYFSNDSTTYYKVNAIRAKGNRNMGNYDTSFKLYSKNYQYYIKTKDSLRWADAADQVGTILMYQGDVDQAQGYYVTALELYKKVGEQKDIANMYNGFAGLFSYLGENEKTLDYLQQGMEIYESIKDTVGQANLWANIGFTYMEMGNFDAAESSFKKQYRLDSLTDSEWGIGYHYDYMGELRNAQGRNEEAVENYAKAIEIRSKLTNSFNLAATKITMADALIELSRHKEAQVHLSDVLSQAEEHGSLSFMQQVYRLKAISYKKQGAYKQSLMNHEKYKVISDSIFNQDKIDAFAEKDAKYEVSQKEVELKNLQLEDTLNQTRLSQQRWTIGGLGVGLGLLSLLVYNLVRQKKKIQIQSEAISKSAAEKDILLREIHHRVKNNLQVISSLLGIQGRGIKDKRAKEAIQEGRNRVQSMALIHQNLYKKDNLTGIEMAPYIDKLANHLLHTYQVESGNIKVGSEVDAMTLDVETVVPIGLIINELISNSLKYAFPNNGNGIIGIELRDRGDHLLMIVSDNGIGLSDEQLKSKSETFGHSLIRAFKNKLDADISITGDAGTKVALLIRNYKKLA